MSSPKSIRTLDLTSRHLPRLLRVISGHFTVQPACPLYPQKRTFSDANRMSALCQKRTQRKHGRCFYGSLLNASATFAEAPVFCGPGDEVRARIAPATIACQYIRPTFFDRAILAVPIALRDHRAPRSLVGLRRVSPKDRSSKSNDKWPKSFSVLR